MFRLKRTVKEESLHCCPAGAIGILVIQEEIAVQVQGVDVIAEVII